MPISKPGIWLEYWLPLLLWCGLVQYFSSDAFSYGETSRFITPVLAFLFPTAGPDTLDLLHQVVRKLGHVLEFMAMGWLAVRALRFRRPEAEAVLASLAFVVMLAAVDEWHQALTATRGPSLADVGYDCLGGVLGISLSSGSGVPGSRLFGFR